ncbi:MAG: sulfurtransferase TusA family protein [Bacteroidaceae bacterium]|nr:sulfurtransferase TusA family protein [Bacteroidaceae bacterium]
MYKIPDTLTQDIDKFGRLSGGYRKGDVSPVEFKAFRVPLGVYEQRKNEVYMARVRATGGVITPKQLLKVIDIAKSNGSNLLHITTRAEVQILNLQLDSVQTVLQQLQSVGLATKGGGGNTVRNILVSEFSGISNDEVFDTTPYAMALTDAVVPESDSYTMPRKMKIAFSSDDKFIDYAGINDVGLVAQIKDGRRGFKVYVGGGAGSKPSVGWLYKDFLPAEDLYALVKGLKTFFNENGNRKDKYKARIRFIFYKLGKEETFRLIDKYVEEAKKSGKMLDVRPDDFPHSKEGDRTVVLPFKLGNIWLDDEAQLDKLKAILEFADRFGNHTVRFTTRQNIRFRNIPDSAFAEFEKLLDDFSADYRKPLVLNNIVSCTGADTCRLGICLSKGLANAIYKSLEDSGLSLDHLDDARINISGCPNLCGQPLWADLGFVGKVLHTDHVYPAYQVYVGANYVDSPALAESIGNIAAYNVPRFVADLVAKFNEIADLAENIGVEINFGKWIRSSAGRKTVAKIVAKYQNVPLFSEDKNYYFDFESDEVFSVTKRGKPECSAGIYDMITVDQQYIKEAQGKDDYAVIFHASRMLLVTRGLDPQQPSEVFDAFIEHFIDAGYIDASFKSLVLKAKADGKGGTYDSAQANALADAVNALYLSMDDALQFKKPDEKTSAAPQSEVEPEPKAEPEAKSEYTRSKDLRGVLCPMNFVRTKLELATLKTGDTLEILLDDGKPIENVPGSVKLEGHEILSQTQTSEGYWQVVIRKK